MRGTRGWHLPYGGIQAEPSDLRRGNPDGDSGSQLRCCRPSGALRSVEHARTAGGCREVREVAVVPGLEILDSGHPTPERGCLGEVLSWTGLRIFFALDTK